VAVHSESCQPEWQQDAFILSCMAFAPLQKLKIWITHLWTT
jgi:hypothetical protein